MLLSAFACLIFNTAAVQSDAMESRKRPTIVIGNKIYSSWSLRAWLALRHAMAGKLFDEVKIPLAGANATAERKQEVKKLILDHSPNGKVPALVDNNLGIVVYDSLAICLHVAEMHPEARLLPSDPAAKALCLCACAEMHSGFAVLRNNCPMNCIAEGTAQSSVDTLQIEGMEDELKRLGELWSSLRSQYGAASTCAPPDLGGAATSCDPAARGPYLFGHFTLADCMFAPIALRLKTYFGARTDAGTVEFPCLAAYPLAQEYVRTLLNDPLIAEWVAGAVEEAASTTQNWKIDSYESVVK